jgi:hypothetical protein
MSRGGRPDHARPCNVKLSLGRSIHDPTDPVGRLLFNVLAMVAEFEADLRQVPPSLEAAIHALSCVPARG